MTEQDIILKLTVIKNNFGEVVNELEKLNGKISTEVLDLLDSINQLSVRI